MADRRIEDKHEQARQKTVPVGAIRLLDVSLHGDQLHCVNQWPITYTREDFLKVAAFAVLHLARNADPDGDPLDFWIELEDYVEAAKLSVAPPKEVL